MRPASISGRIHGERRMRFMMTDRMILRPRKPMERPMSRMLAAGLLVLSGISPAFAAAPDCDRSCLAGFIDQYVDALVAGDPQRLAVTDAVRFTEDSQELPLGEGLWKAQLTRGGFRHDYLDVRKQIAATHVELREGGNPVLFSLVLHVEQRRIAGIETLVQRITPQSRMQPTMLGTPLARMDDPVPVE